MVRGPVLTDTPLARIRAMLDEEEKAAAASATDVQEVTEALDGESVGAGEG